MTDASLIALFVRPLNQLRVPYMVTGGVASVVYGEPRFTRDIDLVIELRPRDARRFAGAWPAGEFYVPPVEVIEEESGRAAHGHFNVIHHRTAMRAEPGHWRTRSRGASTKTRSSWRRIEAVILSKLRYYQMGKSDRHLRDIHQMLRISGDLVDRPELERWAARLGVEGEWKQAQNFPES
jgi:hypothetical protein